MFPSTIAGSLPKPHWLAEPNRLWAPWRLEGSYLCSISRTFSRENWMAVS
jgi:5-methyltetrahydropteroyltriglutamate--homocysteine methyltransferase